MICKTCGQDKELDLFPKNKNCISGYEGTCKQCSYEKQQVWKQTHQQQYRDAKHTWYEKNKESVFEKAKEYARLNPEWKAEHCAKRRRRTRLATPVWDIELTEFVAEEARSLSRLRNKLTGIMWHVDHIVPLRGKSVCGLHVWNNLAVIPAVDNIKKGNRYECSINL